MIIRIFNKDFPLHSLLFVIGEGVLIYAAVLMAAFLRLGGAHASFLSGEVLGKALWVTLIWQGCLYYSELYNLKVTHTDMKLSLRLIKAMSICFLVLAAVYYCIPSLLVGRGILIVSFVFIVPLIVLWRYAYNWVLKKKMFTQSVMIIGSGKLCKEIVNEIKDCLNSGYRVGGVIFTNSSSPSGLSPDIPIFSMVSMDGGLCDLADSLGIKKIIVAMDERRGYLPTEELLRCKMKGIQIIEGESLYEQLTGKLFVEKLNPSCLIFSNGFRKSEIVRLTKWAVDIIMASVGLLLTSPLIGLIALAIKFDSKGPVFFEQDRCGEADLVFKLYKFRSMIDNAEAASGPCWATENDRRVTKLGRILRKYRLDEIPQMWNVLKGDMSFVGPRPERPEFVRNLGRVISYYSERHTVKPGITGWAQVCYHYGASVEDSTEKLKCDMFYIKNMSLAIDLIIILKTIKVMLLNTGAR